MGGTLHYCEVFIIQSNLIQIRLFIYYHKKNDIETPLFTSWFPSENDILQFSQGLTSVIFKFNENQDRINQDNFVKKKTEYITAEINYTLNNKEKSILERSTDERQNNYGRSMGDLDYPDLGKKIYDIFYPSLMQLESILIFIYGQYWSRFVVSVSDQSRMYGNFFSSYRAKWKYISESEENWKVFCPTGTDIEFELTLPSGLKEFSELISENDFSEIQNLLNQNLNISDSLYRLQSIRELMEKKDYIHALVDAVSVIDGLEQIHSFPVRFKKERNRILSNNLWINQSNINKPSPVKGKPAMREKLEILYQLTKVNDINILDHAINGIDRRHHIIHQNNRPTSTEYSNVIQ